MPLQDSIGFGDSDNDLQMTDVVGISVCMANGSASLKQRCDRIAPSVYEDGISKEFAALADLRFLLVKTGQGNIRRRSPALKL